MPAHVGRKTYAQLVSNMVSTYQSIIYAGNDSEIMMMNFKVFHQIIMSYYNGASEELLDRFKQELNEAISTKSMIELIITVIMIILSILVCVVMVFIRYKQNLYRNVVLQKIKILSKETQFREKILVFLKTTSGESV